MVVKLNLSLQLKKKMTDFSENEGQVVYSAGHYFQIIDGVRHWLTQPPNDYICTNGSVINETCRH